MPQNLCSDAGFHTHTPDHSLDNMVGRPRLDSLSSVEEDDYDTLADIESDKNVIRTKVPSGGGWLRGRESRCPAGLKGEG